MSCVLRVKSGLRERHIKTYDTEAFNTPPNRAAVKAFNHSKRRRFINDKRGQRVVYKHPAQ